MSTLGFAMPPPASFDALLEIAAYPDKAKANIAAIREACVALETLRTEVVERERLVAEREQANNEAAAQLEKDEAALAKAKAAQERSEALLRDARALFAKDRAAHQDAAAKVAARDQELTALTGQLAQARADMDARGEEIASEQHTRSIELNARAEAVAKAESDLKAKISEWQRVTKSIAGLS